MINSAALLKCFVLNFCVSDGVIFLNSKLRSELVDKLFEAILLLRNKEECYSFLRI